MFILFCVLGHYLFLLTLFQQSHTSILFSLLAFLFSYFSSFGPNFLRLSLHFSALISCCTRASQLLQLSQHLKGGRIQRAGSSILYLAANVIQLLARKYIHYSSKSQSSGMILGRKLKIKTFNQGVLLLGRNFQTVPSSQGLDGTSCTFWYKNIIPGHNIASHLFGLARVELACYYKHLNGVYISYYTQLIHGILRNIHQTQSEGNVHTLTFLVQRGPFVPNKAMCTSPLILACQIDLIIQQKRKKERNSTSNKGRWLGNMGNLRFKCYKTWDRNLPKCLKRKNNIEKKQDGQANEDFDKIKDSVIKILKGDDHFYFSLDCRTVSFFELNIEADSNEECMKLVVSWRDPVFSELDYVLMVYERLRKLVKWTLFWDFFRWLGEDVPIDSNQPASKQSHIPKFVSSLVFFFSNQSVNLLLLNLIQGGKSRLLIGFFLLRQTGKGELL
ncbi:hypothetical protein VP01_5017g2 [Puccinia sorghi]|uniref:Uncharacterized protein n=1 Tax=Puccinia sorghi TaxID=27349 RepID=A0A0L6ULM9_9BASI|nr:hypothetical protein VP01_5017g2 [Puccinia sorghi]